MSEYDSKAVKAFEDSWRVWRPEMDTILRRDLISIGAWFGFFAVCGILVLAFM
jgi:hypothetical protein